MTREEATIQSLMGHIEALENTIKRQSETIKALEQEPILDNIRAEIEALEEGITSYHNDRPWIFKDEVLEIIDKYKAESEDKE